MFVSMLRFVSTSVAAAFLFAGVAFAGMDASHDHAGHMMSMDGEATASSLPGEPGQGAFAAIAEIVAMLSADPNTDWSHVDIDALRNHLVDMNEVTLNSDAVVTETDDSIVFRVTGSGRTIAAIQSMVPAHAAELTRTGTWEALGAPIENGATLTIAVTSPQEREKLKALGFYGVMATGAHHQQHHLWMATGRGH
jgi:hypothetical protein